MHFEVLVEDASGKKTLDILIPRIIGEQHSFEVRAYKGIGRIPKDFRKKILELARHPYEPLSRG